MSSHGWIFAAAGYNMALAAFHISFWRIFRWKEQLPQLHPVNQGVMQVMNAMLIYFFALMAILQLAFAAELNGSPLGRALLLFMAGFWLVRAILQPVFFGPTTPMRWAFTAIFIVGAVLHVCARNT